MARRVKAGLQSAVAIVWVLLILARHPSFGPGGAMSPDMELIELIWTAFIGVFAIAAIEFLFRTFAPQVDTRCYPKASDTDTKQ